MEPIYEFFGRIEQQESLPETDNHEAENDHSYFFYEEDKTEEEREFIFTATMSGTGEDGGRGGTTAATGEEMQDSGILNFEQRNYLVIALLVGLIILLVLTLLYLVVPPFMAWLRRPKPEDDDKRLERRYETIEGWLISKRVRAHDEDCAKLRLAFCKPTSSKDQPSSPKSIEIEGSASFDSADTAKTSCGDEESGEGEKECPICMEPFAVDDIVSWSPNVDATCRHVFHHECIKEWMLQSGNCPCCRELILPIDEEGFSLERPALKELCRKRARLAATTYYCHTDGFVCFEAPSGGCTRKSIEMLKSATACRIKPKDLVERRGHRTGATIDDDEDLSSGESNNSGHEQEASSNRQPTGPNSTAGELTLSLVEGHQLSPGQAIRYVSVTGQSEEVPSDEESQGNRS